MKQIMLITLALMLLWAVDRSTAQEMAPPDTPMLLQGQVTDTEGNPIADVVVEIWQTDINGVYDHPGDSTPDELVPDFQYFGTATTNTEGAYAFLTIKPGQYEPRPVHIHFKVKQGDDTLLTSQFYFAEDGTRTDSTLLLEIEDVLTLDDAPLRIATGDIVLDLNGLRGNDLPPTRSQQEGPFYPVVDFEGYDNNLLNPQTDEDPDALLITAGVEEALEES